MYNQKPNAESRYTLAVELRHARNTLRKTESQAVKKVMTEWIKILRNDSKTVKKEYY